MTTPELHLRRLAADEDAGACGLLNQLRIYIDAREILQRLSAQRAAHGYELVGAFADGALRGVLGMRPVHTLARGAHLHVDDLVVDGAWRGRGVGAALLAFAEADARQRGLASVFIDSRPEVIAFYEKLGYQPHDATLMRRRL